MDNHQLICTQYTSIKALNKRDVRYAAAAMTEDSRGGRRLRPKRLVTQPLRGQGRGMSTRAAKTTAPQHRKTRDDGNKRTRMMQPFKSSRQRDVNTSCQDAATQYKKNNRNDDCPSSRHIRGTKTEMVTLFEDTDARNSILKSLSVFLVGAVSCIHYYCFKLLTCILYQKTRESPPLDIVKDAGGNMTDPSPPPPPLSP